MARNWEKYENYTITELEKEMEKIDTIGSLYSGMIMVCGLFLVLIFSNVRALPAFAADIQKEAVGVPRSYANTQIKIAAEVPCLLGLKKIDEDTKNLTYTVFGNMEKGFVFFDSEKWDIVYQSNKIPGEGMIVKLPKKVFLLSFDALF